MAGCLTLIVGIAVLVSAAAVRSETREEVEAFLLKARVVADEEVGEGITHSRRVTLEREGRRQRALFKIHEAKYGVLKDSYRHEIAAYELDKLLGLGFVPSVVERRIGRKLGSLQAWAEGGIPRFGHGAAPPPWSRVRDQIHAFRLFDYLIYNVDRHKRNVILTDRWDPIAIDHSLSFTVDLEPIRGLYRFPAGPIDRLRAMDRSAVDEALGRYLDREQIDALMLRRAKVLSAVDRLVAGEGEGVTLFIWPVDD